MLSQERRVYSALGHLCPRLPHDAFPLRIELSACGLTDHRYHQTSSGNMWDRRDSNPKTFRLKGECSTSELRTRVWQMRLELILTVSQTVHVTLRALPTCGGLLIPRQLFSSQRTSSTSLRHLTSDDRSCKLRSGPCRNRTDHISLARRNRPLGT